MSSPPSAAEIFCTALPEEAREGWLGLGALEVALVQAHGRACPPDPCPPPSLERHMASLAARLGEVAPAEATLTNLDHAAIALADGCVDAEPRAVTAFLRVHARDVDHAITRSRAPDRMADDIRQIVLAKLLPPGRKLARYSGRGSLQHWVRAVTVRESISAMRSADAPVVDDDAVADLAASGDLELSFVKRTYRDRFRVALRETFAALDAEDRALLRYRFLDGLTLDQLAVLLGVHRATVARWLARLRETLLRGVRGRVREQLGGDVAEFEGMIALVRSNLEITIGGLLRDGP